MAADHVYRAQTVGSLLRPPELKQARHDLEAQQITPLEFKRIEDEAVDRALALQTQAGLDIVSDGEMRRAHFTGPLSEVVAGMDAVEAPVQHWHGSAEGDEPTYAHVRAVTGKLRRLRSLASEEFTYLRARTQKPIKATLPSPLMMQTFWSPEHTPAAYADPFELFADAAAILREEARELVALGCEFIQLDAPDIGFLVDASVRDSLQARGIDPARMLREGIEIIDSVADVRGARFGIHLCKGNREGHWLAAGGYAAISNQVFPRLRHFDVLLLEYDDERSGGFEPLAVVPRTRRSCSGWSRPSGSRSNRQPTSYRGSSRRPSTSRATSLPSRLNAGSLRSWPATRSRPRSRSESSTSWPRPRAPPGPEVKRTVTLTRPLLTKSCTIVCSLAPRAGDPMPVGERWRDV